MARSLAYEHQYHLEKPKIRAEVIGLIASGFSTIQIAQQLNCTPPAISQFRKRHRDEINALIARIEAEVEDYAISRTANRIADAQMRRDLLEQVRQARAAGGTGIETGIVVRQYRAVGDAMVEEYKVDTATLAEWRANEKHVAEQLHQLDEKSGLGVQVNVPITTVYMSVPGVPPSPDEG